MCKTTDNFVDFYFTDADKYADPSKDRQTWNEVQSNIGPHLSAAFQLFLLSSVFLRGSSNKSSVSVNEQIFEVS